MLIDQYRWSCVDEFLGREHELSGLEAWWASSGREPLVVQGPRGAGKTWLLHRFAHGKPAVVLVGDRVARGAQLARLTADLEIVFGYKPDIPDVASLFREVQRAEGRRKILLAIDDFEYLLGTTAAESRATLVSIQSVLKELRDSSRIKVLLCVSTAEQVEKLEALGGTPQGRQVPLETVLVRALSFASSKVFSAGLPPTEQLTRYAIGGGLPRYLMAFTDGDMAERITTQLVDRRAPLFNEPRMLLATELREPASYFSILAVLARVPADVGTIATELRTDGKAIAPHLVTLERLGLISRHLPVGAAANARTGRYGCEDHFVRFWFRAVAPGQAQLEAGADAFEYVRQTVLPQIADHASPVFEEVLQDWVRQVWTEQLSSVGSWWGPSLRALRRGRTGSSEEIDVVGLKGARAVVVGEGHWADRAMGAEVLADLRENKIPALRQAGLKTHPAPTIVLASREGFSDELRSVASTDRLVELVDADRVLTEVR